MKKLFLASFLTLILSTAHSQWEQICTAYQPNYAITAYDSTVIAGISSSNTYDLALSLDAGNTWTGADPLAQVNGISYLETGAEWIYACTPGGVFRADKDNLNWEPYHDGLTGNILKVLDRDSILLAFNSTAIFSRLLTDSAWTFLCDNFPQDFISDIDYDGARIVAAGDDGVCESIDMGETWTMWTGLEFVTGRIVIKGDTIIFASPGGVMRKLISTGSMANISSGLIKLWTPPPGWDYYGTFEDLHTVGDHIFLCGETGLYKLKDNTWQWEHTGLTGWAYAMADNGETLFSANNGSGIWARPLDQLIVGTPDYKPETAEVKIFPNPASDWLTIDYNGSDLASPVLYIYNQSGAMMPFRGTEVMQNKIRIHLKELSPGLYLGKLISENGQYLTFSFLVGL